MSTTHWLPITGRFLTDQASARKSGTPRWHWSGGGDGSLGSSRR